MSAANDEPALLKILVADEKPDLVAAPVAALCGQGHEVRVVSSGNDALATLQSFSADVVLLDIGMPGRDGYDTAREIRQRYRAGGPLLVATTGYSGPKDPLLARIVGIHRHFSKPLDTDTLLRAVARVAADKMDPERTVRGNAAPSRPPRARKIIVADDNRDAVVTLVAILRDEGHEAQGVYRAQDVLPLARSFDPDVFILDIAMPEQSGYALAQEVRRSYIGGRRALLIAVTGEYRGQSDALLSKVAGFDHHLTKPYDPLALVGLLKSPPPEHPQGLTGEVGARRSG